MSILQVADQLTKLQQNLIEESEASTKDMHKLLDILNQTRNNVNNALAQMEDIIVRSATERQKSIDMAIGHLSGTTAG